MATNNSVDSPLSGTTGTGNFVGSVSPSLTTPTITGNIQAPTGITSGAGLNLLTLSYTASAVNYISMANNSTGASPLISATGSDSNVTLQLSAKGTGGVTIQGTGTNDSPSAGYVGEFISSVIASTSSVSLTTGVAEDLTSISLTAGDWDVYGNVTFIPTGTTNVTFVLAWISTASATVPDSSLYNILSFGASGLVSSTDIGIIVPYKRISIASTTTVYISAEAGFTVSTETMCGGIYARRRR